MFNLILAAFGVLTLIFGDASDALFLGIIVANSAIGITQEVLGQAGARPALAGLEPWGLVVLAEQLRPNVRDTVAFLQDQRVEIKVLSGDAPKTVAAIARDVGSGTQMARSVADLALINGDFASVPPLVAEGRRALRNLQRVSKLYVTKSAFAAFLIMTIGLSSDA